MTSLNWSIFESLPGAAERNFEVLCRSLMRQHYAQFGHFRGLLNQPGVEFHLNLTQSCTLGSSGRWFGWQCRWYGIPSGRALGKTRRDKIEVSIRKTEECLPGVTDWILWTRHPLAKRDQEWFYNLTTKMTLHAWSSTEVEEHLYGPATVLREPYFGELVLTDEVLTELRKSAVARIGSKWLPEVHQTVDAERVVRRMLVSPNAWAEVPTVATRLRLEAQRLDDEAIRFGPSHSSDIDLFATAARASAELLESCFSHLASGYYEALRDTLAQISRPAIALQNALRQLRSARHLAVLCATNILADLHYAHTASINLLTALDVQLIAIVADAGCGKTHLSAEITAGTDTTPAGVLMFGADLHAGHTLDDLARRIVIRGKPLVSFESLIAAVNAAGERLGKRLPLLIDGLNEAEDPRDWCSLLSALTLTLRHFPYVCVACTLRSGFVRDALPKDVATVAIPGFDDDSSSAIQRYFAYYRIDATDADLPLPRLRHPLTLRIFCEVTNFDRKRTVGIERMPDSLSRLFEMYLDQTSERISELSAVSQRYYPSDVRSALSSVGLTVWSKRTRTVELRTLRVKLADEFRPWSQSIVYFLEGEGVLIRLPSQRPGSGRESISFDLLAGHIVADALLDRVAGRRFERWLASPAAVPLLSEDYKERHPLAEDVFRALVALTPQKLGRRQLWTLLSEPARSEALHQTAWLEARFLDSETVQQLAVLIAEPPKNRTDLFRRLWTTRSAQHHPLNSLFLTQVLAPMSVPDRDLRWSEWIRDNHKPLIDDLRSLENRWMGLKPIDEKECLRARWVMWLLTSTVRVLRDHATYSLYLFGCAGPSALFAMTLEALEINDPYVPERMLAASYGVSMALWADPADESLRAALPSFARQLVSLMWEPNPEHSTQHALMQDYSLGIITLAIRIAPDCIAEESQRFILPPFQHLPVPFRQPNEIDESVSAIVDHAIHMDFGNYTIGALIPHRSNYDFTNKEYRQVRLQIEGRIAELGYSAERFDKVDRLIADASWHSRSRNTPPADRYGKKYSWIAYFEMYGIRRAKNQLREWWTESRPANADIDPSFPQEVLTWQPKMPDIFADAPTDLCDWISVGPTPDYSYFLELDEVDGQKGPWVLLDGYISQTCTDDGRRAFTFLRGLMLPRTRVRTLFSTFNKVDYPGNSAIPSPREDYYTFAGEIPWSRCFGSSLRNARGVAKRNIERAFEYFGTGRNNGVLVEIPVHHFSWESHHSELNQVGSVTVPAPAICEALDLTSRQGQWDFYSPDGRVATLCRKWKADGERHANDLLYLRGDLLETYLKKTKQVLVWLNWGERTHDYIGFEQHESEIRRASAGYRHIHRCALQWHASGNGGNPR